VKEMADVVRTADAIRAAAERSTRPARST